MLSLRSFENRQEVTDLVSHAISYASNSESMIGVNADAGIQSSRSSGLGHNRSSRRQDVAKGSQNRISEVPASESA